MDEKYLTAKLSDALRLCEKSGHYKAVGFLSSKEAAVCDAFLKNKGEKYCFFGGYNEAERTKFVALPFWCDNAEDLGIITPITFTFRKEDNLSHRDFLGYLMSLGIERECVGDILVESGRAVAFLDSEIVGYVMSQTKKVGNVGVTVGEGYASPLPQANVLSEFSVTVASMRLDGVVSAFLGLSRESAKQLITDGLVSVNSICVTKTTHTLRQGDSLSIKGKGRFVIGDCSSLSKKGRVVLHYLKYV